MAEYLIAFRREFREQTEPEWEKLLAGITGLEVKNPGARRRVRVEATPEALSEIRERLANRCHIEPVIRHRHV